MPRGARGQPHVRRAGDDSSSPGARISGGPALPAAPARTISADPSRSGQLRAPFSMYSRIGPGCRCDRSTLFGANVAWSKASGYPCCPPRGCPCATTPPGAAVAPPRCWSARHPLPGRTSTGPATTSAGPGTVRPLWDPGSPAHGGVAAPAVPGAECAVVAAPPGRARRLGSRAGAQTVARSPPAPSGERAPPPLCPTQGSLLGGEPAAGRPAVRADHPRIVRSQRLSTTAPPRRRSSWKVVSAAVTTVHRQAGCSCPQPVSSRLTASACWTTTWAASTPEAHAGLCARTGEASRPATPAPATGPGGAAALPATQPIAATPQHDHRLQAHPERSSWHSGREPGSRAFPTLRAATPHHLVRGSIVAHAAVVARRGGSQALGSTIKRWG